MYCLRTSVLCMFLKMNAFLFITIQFNQLWIGLLLRNLDLKWEIIPAKRKILQW